MSVLNENTLMGASAAVGGYAIDNSLRFNDDDSAYLSRTPSVAGNRKTWTISLWLKYSISDNSANNQGVLGAYNSGTGFSGVMISQSANIPHRIYVYNAGANIESTQLLRDPSGWYHICAVSDTTQGTASDRTKLYINGSLVTDLSSTNYPSLNAQGSLSDAALHVIGDQAHSSTLNRNLDGYLSEVNFIDGQALTPDDFGETGVYGEWVPKEYTGTYGTNGFYLPFKQDYAVEGFSTMVYEGTGASQYIGGTGFAPDLTWFKSRNTATDYEIYDTIRGYKRRLSSNNNMPESTSLNGFAGWAPDGFNLDDNGGGGDSNTNGRTYVSWNWDMGGTTVTNTDGTTTSSVRANQAYGQSIVSYIGNKSGATVGHGLSKAPDIIIIKNRNISWQWRVYSSALDATGYLDLGSKNKAGSNTDVWNSTNPTSSVFSLGKMGRVNSSNLIAYCFHSVAGYSEFSSYEGTSGTQTVTLGFTPAFVMIKNVDADGNWTMWDNTRNPNNPVTQLLRANTNGAEETQTTRGPSFTTTGFTIGGSNVDTNASGDTYSYMAFADTREYAFWLDQSGNNNDWASKGGLTESDVMLDSPTNNFAVCNPLTDSGNRSVKSEGNLRSTASGAGWAHSPSSISMSAGKWYSEMLLNTAGEGIAIYACVTDANDTSAIDYNSNNKLVGYQRQSGDKVINGTVSSYGYGYNAGDTIGIALDMDAKTLTFYKNNASQGTISSIPYVNAYFDAVVTDDASVTFNFGQDSSFAGNKTPQGNSDANGIGDFYYAPPSGFLALCTKNLDTPTVVPSEHFNTVLYTGDGSGNKVITGVGFQPDFLWIKPRSAVGNHGLWDSVRGRAFHLRSNSTNAEASSGAAYDVKSFDSDGFTVGSSNQIDTNTNGVTTVAWNWKAGGGTGVSNTDGTITSTVSANVDAGFSIVSYRGTGSGGATLGHGLASAPEMVIVKNRSVSRDWQVHRAVNKRLVLNEIVIEYTDSLSISNFGASTITWAGGNSINNSPNTFIAYCFHSVDGYSKVGSYIGNGSTDGTFVHCGFRPKYIMIRSTTNSRDWLVYDTARGGVYNEQDEGPLQPNTSGTPYTNSYYTAFDIVSNGFKLRAGTTNINANGEAHIFYAIAESPFKHSNAR